MRIDLIAGARPNFMKIAPIIHAIKKTNSIDVNVNFRLIHTGQHYDKNMSDQFFDQLAIPKPDFNLGAGSGTQSEQTSAIMKGYEKVLDTELPNLCLVVGDVTSTLACSIVAKKKGVRVAHVEGGIRSRDWSMPEEINRVVTDSISDYFFTTSEIANKNLVNQGITKDKIFLVGNTMIDTLIANMDKLTKPQVWDELALTENNFFVMTLHRPANVDEQENLKLLIQNIVEGTSGMKIVFPAHPRTKKILTDLGISYTNLHFVEPLGYLEFNYLVKHARAVITDSGGITEETTVMDVPCLTMRNNTERPETVTQGTNELIGTDPTAIKPALDQLLKGNWKKGCIPDKWDGKSAERIIDIIIDLYKKGAFNESFAFKDNVLLYKPGSIKSDG